MTITTPPTPRDCASPSDRPASVALEKAPESTRTSILPVWAADRNQPGSDARRLKRRGLLARP